MFTVNGMMLERKARDYAYRARTLLRCPSEAVTVCNGLASVRPFVCLSAPFSNLNGARGAYLT